MRGAWIAVGLCLVAGSADTARADAPSPASVSFRNEIQPILTKAGCNQGACHGNARGKGGFQLSLRGEDSERDLATLTRDWEGRRVNSIDPPQSLLLKKAAMRVPHEGGKRIDEDSPEHQKVAAWIGLGMPDDVDSAPRINELRVEPRSILQRAPWSPVALRVEATFSNGETRDVSRLAVLEASSPIVEFTSEGAVRPFAAGETTVLVRFLEQRIPVRFVFLPERSGAELPAQAAMPPARNSVDEHIFAKLKELEIPASPLCDDATFVRRLHLDLTGRIPSDAVARAFVDNVDERKRDALIDELLESQAFADRCALYWADLLRVEEKTLDRKGVGLFHAWLRNQFANNRPLNETAAAIVAARGSTYVNPAANFYRAAREPTDRSESIAQAFLGVRLQCAKCHNHPFDAWTQNDYYSWASLFARVDYKILDNNRRDRNDKHQFDGEQIVFLAASGEVKDPRTGQPRAPRVLDPQARNLATEADPLDELANWLTSPNNDLFATLLANRIWKICFGRALVDPVDDLRLSNPASHPALLKELADDLRTARFDQRVLFRKLLQSTAYQLSSETVAGNRADETNFSHAYVRRLSAEQLADSLSLACGAPIAFRGYPAGVAAGQVAGVKASGERGQSQGNADRFLKMFGRPQRLQSCGCERSDEPTLNQSFEMVSGELINSLIAAPNNAISDLPLESSDDVRAAVSRVTWRTLSRESTADELDAAVEHWRRHRNESRAALEDMLWSLLNSHEFMFRR